MQALVLMGFVLVTAVMWVGVIMMMLTGLYRAEHRDAPAAPDPEQETDREKSEASRGGVPELRCDL
ncbi:UNVERIFIED_CONTAM: hypothetical protein ABIE34_003388 [Jeotgalibacillus campisalis]